MEFFFLTDMSTTDTTEPQTTEAEKEKEANTTCALFMDYLRLERQVSMQYMKAAHRRSIT
jgi:uncharacterized protein YueI